MTADINACAEGCKAGGADLVVVRDGHGGSYSVRWEKLSPAVDEVLCGPYGDDRFEGIDGFDGLILLGYHAMAGTGAAVLSLIHILQRFQQRAERWCRGFSPRQYQC